MKFYICSLIYVAVCNAGFVYGLNNLTALRQNLTTGYDKENFPMNGTMENIVEVEIVFYLRHVNDFDEVAGQLRSTVIIQTFWKDPRLFWNPDDYQAFNGPLTFTLDKIWIPHVIIWNPVDNFIILDPENDYLLASVFNWKNSGFYVSYVAMGVLATHCIPDVTYFPFDKHICNMDLVVYESLYNHKNFKLGFKLEESDLHNFTEHPQWDVIPMNPGVFNFSGMEYVRFPFLIERRSRFMLCNIVVPAIMISFLNVFAFAIPIDGGERISFSVSVFLSMIFFITIIVMYLPHSSYPMPYWSWYLVLKIVHSSLITLFSITLVRYSQRTNDKDIPNPVLKFVHFMEKYIFHKTFMARRRMNSSDENTTISTSAGHNDRLCVTCANMEVKATKPVCEVSWKYVTYLADKILIFVFGFMFFADIFFMVWIYYASQII